MATKKKKRFDVLLGAALPTTATLRVEAYNEDEARELADELWANADWSGPDSGNRPQGADVEIIRVTEVQ